MSRARPWPRSAKVTVAALAAIFVIVAVWKGDQAKPPSTVAGGVATTSTTVAPVTATEAPAPEPTTRSGPTGGVSTSSTAPAGATTSTTSRPTTTSTMASPATTAPVSAAGAANRPNPALSPGVADPAVTQANIHSTICVSGYTATVRNVSTSTKDKVYAEYGITSHAPGSYEVDHLISLELGGSNDIRNLWPEPYTGDDNARDKDVMENRLHDEVCAGTITLAQGQDEIVHWWLYE